MRRVLCFVALFAASAHALAGPPDAFDDWMHTIKLLESGHWHQVGPVAGAGLLFVSYRDAHAAGPIEAVWVRVEGMNSLAANDVTYKSSVTREEFNCATRETRVVGGTYYSENNLAGKATSPKDLRPSDWSGVATGSPFEALLTTVCSPAFQHTATK